MAWEKSTMKELNKEFASELINKTWDLLDKSQRTQEDELNMIHYSHASRYHWGQIGGPEQMARGEWQISRVYSILGLKTSALCHGQISLDYCETHELGAFDTAFAHEAMARIYNISKDKAKHYHFDHAFNLIKMIEEQENKDWLRSNLNEIM